MTGAQSDPAKWHLPGWRIEQRFTDKTLIGNWCEERKQFQRGTHSNSSTHRTDFRYYPEHKPDVIVRRSALMRNDGLQKEHMFTHHGKRPMNSGSNPLAHTAEALGMDTGRVDICMPDLNFTKTFPDMNLFWYSNNMISWYDEQFNKRDREEGDRLPDLRKWDGHKLAWAPERSDFPMQGNPTNYGLYAQKKKRWINELKAERQGNYSTDYRNHYHGHPHTAYPHRFASAPRYLSSHFNPITRINKDLWLRRTPFNMAPEYPPQVTPPSAV